MTYVNLDIFPAPVGTPVTIHLIKFLGFIYVEQSGFSMYGNALRRSSGRSPITIEWGWPEGGRGGGVGRSRELTENAESPQMRGRVSRKSMSFFVL